MLEYLGAWVWRMNMMNNIVSNNMVVDGSLVGVVSVCCDESISVRDGGLQCWGCDCVVDTWKHEDC